MNHSNTPTEVHYVGLFGNLTIDLEQGEPYVAVRLANGGRLLSAAEARDVAAELVKAANRIEHGPQRTVGT